MDISNKYCVYVGTTRGVLQQTFCKPDEKPKYFFPEQQSEITALEWGRSEDEIIIGYKNEHVCLYNTNECKYTKIISKLEGEGSIVGLFPLNKSIVIAKHDGVITIWSGKKSDYFSINLEEKGTLDAFLHNKSREEVVATGGECNDFKLWHLETKQCLFKAKSLGHDELNLPIPTSIRGITYFPECEKLNACATKEGHVLLYDERAQRRPVVKFFEKKASYTCIATAYRERQCLVGTTRGYMQLLDMRAPGKCLKTFTTFTGSVTSIVCDPVEPLVAATSLDRFLRFHNLETKELVYKGYLKQNLTKILIKPLVKEEQDLGEEDKIEEPVDEEYEDIFSKMETVTEAIKQKRKSESDKGIKKKKKKIKDDQ
ncbi:WD repeat-containing protein 74 [Tribolium castaneum]|uniref:WD repeat-containing protein 74-like Protein n=1 Tax=Tribolium castaneum TaxID=7070 RepID=D6WPW5_TRICA|nr:PREDICTED: WD repeat-containing protein 74 [Tribolium castaneum]EFA06164.1 WD repeat-containing protein 74-like Protein [Tribolium castaneum]|eukprot:XP_008195646.1 PREDICTED: WD repeat-containing protein 74 [Tribolium castaneum]